MNGYLGRLTRRHRRLHTDWTYMRWQIMHKRWEEYMDEKERDYLARYEIELEMNWEEYPVEYR